MAKLGRINTLRISRIGPYGAYCDGAKLGEILLIKERASTDKHSVGDTVEAFVYLDSDDSVVASTTLPELQAGEIGCLQVVALTRDGAFLNWGLKSDLFVPRSEQMGDMAVGNRCVVLAMLDKTNHRMIGSTKLFRHLAELNEGDFSEGQVVDLIISQKTELGYKAVVEGTHLGILYESEVFQPLQLGQRLKGYVKALRSDRKIDLILQKPSAKARTELEQKILQHLRENKGVSRLTDKSPPADIYTTFAVSKKAYKHAIGALYKSRLIKLSKEQISLVETP